jgi:hypothetical protein
MPRYHLKCSKGHEKNLKLSIKQYGLYKEMGCARNNCGEKLEPVFHPITMFRLDFGLKADQWQ